MRLTSSFVRRRIFGHMLFVFAFFGAVLAQAQTAISVVPTTTLAAETGNNTSTASTFTTQSNGNAGAGNVSKVSTRSLLPAGSTTPIFAHFMPWFGTSSHMNVGYNSTDSNQIAAQVSDMLSRGIQGAIVDWYGPNDSQTNTATQGLMAEAQKRGGAFQFAVMYDGGALAACAASASCDITSQLIGDLTYQYNTYENSAAYFRIQGRPVVPFFAVERYGFSSAQRLDIDWSRVAAAVPGNPLFIFQNAGAFTHPASGGGFSWVMPAGNPADWGAAYLQGFYAAGLQYPSEAAFGAGYKGFDDHLAGWGSGRVMNQTCGQTWLDTFSQINSQYPAGNLPYLQLVTWNDYEEGTEIESGIDSCVRVTASLTSTALSWQITTGNTSTVDHLRVFISQDGTSLMPLSDLPAAATSLPLTSYSLAPGSYTFYVEAIGKPSVRNQMSNAVTLVTGDQPPTANLTVTPASGAAPLTVTATLTGADADGAIASSSIDFGDGTVVSGTSASHSYSRPGTFRVLGIVRDSQGAQTGAGVAVSATNQPPVVQLSASPSSGSAPVTVSVSTAGSYDPDGSIASMSIDFGDGTKVNGASGAHSYYWSGTYTITATATDNIGAVSRASTTVNVQGPQITLSSPAYGATVTSPAHVVASATSANPISSISVLVDGTVAYTGSGGAVDTYVPLKPGFVHQIDVQAHDSAGTSADSVTRVYDQNLPPVAKLAVTPASGTAPLAVSASTAASSDPDGTIAASTINFGDGTVVAGSSASHTYNSAGTYVVTATVTDNLGAQSSTTQSVAVSTTVSTPPPTSGVTVASPTSTTSTNMHVVASAASTYPITAMRVYLDNNSVYATSANSLDTYVQVAPGTHNVTVQAWDSTGAVFKNTQYVTAVSTNTVIPQSGWWWDPKLSGTGFFLEYGGKSANGMFVGGYVYDASGNNTWLVSTGQYTQATSTYTSTWLKETGGQTLTGPYNAPKSQPAGNLTITFTDSTHAVMTRPDGTEIVVQRFSFSSTATPDPPVAGAPQTGWWWAGSSASGTGYGIEVQGSNVFIVAYVYDSSGNPVWYLATGALTTPTSYTGAWDVYAGGPQLTSPEGAYSAHPVSGASVPMSLTFSDTTHGTMTMGSVTIPIVRFQEF